MGKINLKTLSHKVAARSNNYNNVQVEDILNMAFGVIREEVATGKRISLYGFGTFEPFVRHGRWAADPKTKERIWIDELAVMKFRPGKSTKDYLKENYYGPKKETT